MTKYYRRRPTIEAVQVLDREFDMGDMGSGYWPNAPFSDVPNWLMDSIRCGDIWPSPKSIELGHCAWAVRVTMDITYIAEPGDYIVHEVDPATFRRFKVLKQDMFDEAFEKV